ncbi:MAG: prolipoprotein diacylglyceryl transferase [Candidatus Omnitrophota bacterium]
MHPILFKIGYITIYTYGTLVALGILIALYLATKQAAKENIKAEKIADLFLWMIIGGFTGARLAYVFTQRNYFMENPAKIFFANEGFIFYGGFITGFLAVSLYVKRNKLQPWKTADIIAPPLAIAQAIGRIGCFFYGCCYGTTAIPVQLIESLVLFCIFCILAFVRKYKKFDGEVFWLYVLLYAVTRFVIEFFRSDPRGHIWIFSTSQFIAIFMAIAAVAALIMGTVHSQACEMSPKPSKGVKGDTSQSWE